MLKILSRSELHRLQQPGYLVHKVIPEAGLVSLVAEPGSKKTFVAIHIACCIATGQNFFGKPVKHGQVIYLAAEGAAGLHRRILAWEEEQGPVVQDDKFALIGSAVAINDSNGFDEFTAALKARETEYGPISFIVVDTLNSTFSGDENNSRDMTSYIGNCRALTDTLGVSVLLVHHPSKSSSGARGHSSLNGALDQGLEIKGGRNHTFTLKLDAKPPKNDEPAPDIRIGTKSIDLSAHLGFDSAGEPITSIALVQASGPMQTNQSRQLQSLRQQLIESIKKVLSEGSLAKRDLLDSLALDEIKVGTKTIERLLKKLCDDGTLYKPAHGHYALSEPEIDKDE